LIYNIEVAIDALVQGGHRSYELNTGQTTQRVTRENLNELYDLRKNLISELETRLATENINRPVVTVIPEW